VVFRDGVLSRVSLDNRCILSLLKAAVELLRLLLLLTETESVSLLSVSESLLGGRLSEVILVVSVCSLLVVGPRFCVGVLTLEKSVWVFSIITLVEVPFLLTDTESSWRGSPPLRENRPLWLLFVTGLLRFSLSTSLE